MFNNKKHLMVIGFCLAMLFIVGIIVFEVIDINKDDLNSMEIDNEYTTDLKNIINKERIPNMGGIEGAYSPKNDVIIENYKVACFEIRVSQDEAGISDVVFLIRKVSDNKFMGFYHCNDYEIKSDKIIIKADDTPVGTISFSGIFLPVPDGDYWSVSYDTPVVKGKLVIKSNENIVYEKEDQEFTFLIGE